MLRRIYWIALILTLITGLLLYLFKANIETKILLWLLFFLSMILISSIHGIIAHSINPELKGGLIVYPILMGILFAVLFFICLFLIMPLFCSDFLGGSIF